MQDLTSCDLIYNFVKNEFCEYMRIINVLKTISRISKSLITVYILFIKYATNACFDCLSVAVEFKLIDELDFCQRIAQQKVIYMMANL